MSISGPALPQPHAKGAELGPASLRRPCWATPWSQRGAFSLMRPQDTPQVKAAARGPDPSSSPSPSKRDGSGDNLGETEV